MYKLSIGAACELKWPKDKLIVQVLDDSTDPFIKVKLMNSSFSSSSTVVVLFYCCISMGGDFLVPSKDFLF